MANPKQILFDLQKELAGDLLEEVVEIRGKSFTIRLLNEEETGWTYSFVNINGAGNTSTLLSARLAMLSMGVRAIDGCSIEEIFSEDWEAFDEIKKAHLLSTNGNKKKFAIASLFKDVLAEYPPAFIQELQEKWKTLEERRTNAQREVKN